mmetsp:Transcript_60267/g.162513  ORF Transcript_60267/g.162513 Transcript_60267/m.162513 type:complete len:239 (+) Transcript_60267:588-1304(+)
MNCVSFVAFVMTRKPAGREYSSAPIVMLTSPNSKTTSGPGNVRQSTCPSGRLSASSTLRASSQCRCSVTCRGAPRSDVPVSAMATQSPSSHRARGCPPIQMRRTFSCQYPSSGLLTGTHCSSESVCLVSCPPKEISLATESLFETNTPKRGCIPLFLAIWPKKLNSGSSARPASPSPSTPSKWNESKGSVVISVAMITRMGEQRALSEAGETFVPSLPVRPPRHTTSRANSPTISPVP